MVEVSVGEECVVDLSLFLYPEGAGNRARVHQDAIVDQEGRRALALALAREGCELMVCGRNRQDLTSLFNQVSEMGVGCNIMEVDLHDDFWPFANELKRQPVDILINNAGFSHPVKPFQDLAPADLHLCWQMNFYIPCQLIWAALPGMLDRHRGTIVNICSYASYRAVPGLSLYSATKAALRLLTDALAKELATTGVNAFSVSPGGMTTSLRSRLFGEEDAKQQQPPELVAGSLIHVLKDLSFLGGMHDLIVRHGMTYTIPMVE